MRARGTISAVIFFVVSGLGCDSLSTNLFTRRDCHSLPLGQVKGLQGSVTAEPSLCHATAKKDLSNIWESDIIRNCIVFK